MNDELSRSQSTKKGKIETFIKQIDLRQSKLDRLYDALESGSIDLCDLAPRIKKLKTEIDQLQEKVNRHRLDIAANQLARPISKTELKRYVDDLYSLLSDGEFFERKQFLRSFIRRIDVDSPQVEVSYTIPLKQKPPKESEVLSIVTYGGVYETISSTG